MYHPDWFKDGQVVVSAAPTCGINKDGAEQYAVDRVSGTRLDRIDDQLYDDVQAIVKGKSTETVRVIPLATITSARVAVPTYYGRQYEHEFSSQLATRLKGFTKATIAEMIKDKLLTRFKGHGSPSLDLRTGDVPYIKVSDLRAGLVNINPTNMIPRALAERYWKGKSSGLKAFDLISPERASKNIGDFCVLLPGQEQVVLTKEVIVLRPGPKATFDSFYLLWALTLQIVRQQWNRVIFMQTNREDVGRRYEEILLPIPPNRREADAVSKQFRDYYTQLATLRNMLGEYLAKDGQHHFHVGVAEELVATPSAKAKPAIPKAATRHVEKC